MRINPFSESIECLTEKTDTASTTKNSSDCYPDEPCVPDAECSPSPCCNPQSNWRLKANDNKMNCNPDGTLNFCGPASDLSTNRLKNPKESEKDQKESLVTKTPWCHPDDDACNPNDDICGPMCYPDVDLCDPGL